MLKKRIIANLTIKDDIVVQSIGYKKYLPIGSVSVAVQFLNEWGIDEIIISDISATIERKSPANNLFKSISKYYNRIIHIQEILILKINCIF